MRKENTTLFIKPSFFCFGNIFHLCQQRWSQTAGQDPPAKISLFSPNFSNSSSSNSDSDVKNSPSGRLKKLNLFTLTNLRPDFGKIVKTALRARRLKTSKSAMRKRKLTEALAKRISEGPEHFCVVLQPAQPSGNFGVTFFAKGNKKYYEKPKI